MADVFLSYSREDRATVEPFAEGLVQAGYSVWWDRNLTGGERFLSQIQTELDAAKAVVVVWTKRSVESHWVIDEASAGRDSGRLVPVTLDGTLPPLGFRQFQVLDLSRWKPGEEGVFDELRASLARLVGDAAVKPAPSSPANPARTRRLVWAAGIMLTLIAAASLVWSQYRTQILATVYLKAPRFFTDPVEQQIGFATTRDGVRIAYATTGTGPPVVFVLGWGTHLEKGFGSPLYDSVGWIARISEHNRLIRYDGRGFGLSQRDVSDFSLDARRSDLEAVVDALGLKRFAVYGVSAGGPVAATFAARHPDRVTRLILVAARLGPVSREGEDPRLTAERVAAVHEVMRTGWDSPAVRDMWVSIIAPKVDDVDRRVMNEFFRVSADGASMSGFFSALAHEEYDDELARIRVPTLVIYGDMDTTIASSSGVRLASLIPGARLEIVRGADHVGTQDDPRTMKLIEDFLAADAVDTPAK